MAITAGVKLIEFIPTGDGFGTGLCEWTFVGSSATGYLTVADAVDEGTGFITNPTSQITNGTRQVFGRFFVPAKYLALRMTYDTAGSSNPVVKLFGRVRMPDGTAGPWRILPNRVGDTSVTLVVTPADIVGGIGLCTTPDAGAHFFDVQECNEFLLGVEVANDGDFAGVEVLFG